MLTINAPPVYSCVTHVHITVMTIILDAWPLHNLIKKNITGVFCVTEQKLDHN